MKRIISIIILFFFLLKIEALSTPNLEFGVSVGLSVPNDEVSNVLNTERIEEQDFVGNLKADALNTGYNIGAKLRLDLAKKLKFFGGIALNRFPQTDIEVIDPETGELLATMKTIINIIPINAGVNLYLLEKRLGLYLIGDLSYNYIGSSLDIQREGSDVSIPVKSSEVENTIGYGFGAGIDLDVFLGRVNLEAKYNRLNIISFEDNSNAKNYFTVTVGIYF